MLEVMYDKAFALSHRFAVFFFAAGVVPNPVDMLFQKVSGLSGEIETTTIDEGGQNLYKQKMPAGITYNNLVLERGIVVGSPLYDEFNATFSLFKFSPSNVIITLLNESSVPLASWLFMKAFPVKWSLSDFDAEANSPAIETLELSYTRFQPIRV